MSVLALEPDTALNLPQTLTAVVSVVPIFTKGRLERILIDTWKYKIHSTSVARVKTDYFHRREAQVTYAITFDEDAMEWTVEHNYPLSTFFADACALTFLLGVAAWCVKQYHKCRKKPEKLFRALELQIATQNMIDAQQDAGDAEQQQDIDQLVETVKAMQEEIRLLNRRK